MAAIARSLIFFLLSLMAIVAVARAYPQVNVNYPGGFVNIPSPGQVQVAYPGGFVNVPSRFSTFFSGGGRPGGLVTFPGGSVNFGR